MLKKRHLFLMFGLALGGLGMGTACVTYSCKAIVYGIMVDSFEECAEAGFPIVAGDPPRCYLSESRIYTREPQHIRLVAPKPDASVGASFQIAGQARAIGNLVHYELTDWSGQVLAAGEIAVNSKDHGEFGDFAKTVSLEKPPEKGELTVFELSPEGTRDSAVKVALFFASEASPLVTPVKSPSVTPAPDASNAPEPAFDPLQSASPDIPSAARLTVPFTPQAPFADWNPPYDEACEEASILMVHHFLKEEALTPNTANNEIILLADWQAKHGYAVDINVRDTQAVAEEYYDLQTKVYADGEVTIEHIKRLIAAGYPVVIPAAGQLLKNPYFRGSGPPYHMLVITGYDEKRFLTNDPGTKRGEGFAYDQQLLLNAIHDWTGDKNTVTQGQKAMLVLSES